MTPTKLARPILRFAVSRPVSRPSTTSTRTSLAVLGTRSAPITTISRTHAFRPYNSAHKSPLTQPLVRRAYSDTSLQAPDHLNAAERALFDKVNAELTPERLQVHFPKSPLRSRTSTEPSAPRPCISKGEKLKQKLMTMVTI